MTEDQKSKDTSAVVKDLLKIWQRCWTTPSATALRTLGKKPSEPADLSGFSLALTSGSAQSMSVRVFSPAWTITGSTGYVIYILDSENIAKVIVQFPGLLLITGHQVPIRR